MDTLGPGAIPFDTGQTSRSFSSLQPRDTFYRCARSFRVTPLLIGHSDSFSPLPSFLLYSFFFFFLFFRFFLSSSRFFRQPSSPSRRNIRYRETRRDFYGAPGLVCFRRRGWTEVIKETGWYLRSFLSYCDRSSWSDMRSSRIQGYFAATRERSLIGKSKPARTRIMRWKILIYSSVWVRSIFYLRMWNVMQFHCFQSCVKKCVYIFICC